MYSVSDKEFVKLIDEIHDFMAYIDLFISNDAGTISSVSEIPKDCLLLYFGGFNSPIFDLIDMMHVYKERYDEYPHLVMTGKSSNKVDNTSGMGSEVGCYQYILEKCGIPKEIIRRYYIEPTDTSTAENIQSLSDIFKAYPELKGRKIVLATHSIYRRRAVHDFAIKFSDVNLSVLKLPKADLISNIFASDRINGLAVDIMIGAYYYQSMLNKLRWDRGETSPPSKEELEFVKKIGDIAPILKEYSGWIYPNNAVDLGIAASLEEAEHIIMSRRKILTPMLADGLKEIELAIEEYLK